MLRVVGRATWAGSCRVLCVHGVALRFRVPGEVAPKHVRDRGQAVVCLVCRHMVDMRGVGELGGAVLDMSGQGVGVVHASKCLTQRRRLNNPLGGELFMRGSDDRKPRGSLVSAGHAWCLGSEATCVLVFIRAIALGRLLLQPRLDDVPLLVAD